MKFKKSLNNSVALVEENGQTMIVVGKGIGFGLKPGDEVDQSKVERRYLEEADKDQVSGIDSKILAVTTKITKLAKESMNLTLDDHQYLALADHINFAVDREKKGLEIGYSGLARWEVKNLYPKEYELATKAVSLINQEFDVSLPKDEEVLLTYHFVNAANDDDKVQDTMKITELVSGVVNIVQYRYNMVFDTDSFNYSRFITHLRALMVRLVRHDGAPAEDDELDPAILNLMKVKYKTAYETVESISTYLKEKAGWTLSSNDKVYLTIHVWRVTQRQHDD